MRTAILSAAVLLLAAPSMFAAVRLAAPFSDHAVLQRDRSVPVWGAADPGEKVVVSFAGVTRETTADAAGRWRIDLPAMAASTEGRTLTVNDRSVSDVLVGEVWMCSGQSNMELPLVGSNPRFRDRQGATVASLARLPLVRFMNACDLRPSEKPMAFTEKTFAWKPFTPENFLEDKALSAIGVYFVRELHISLGVPVGIVGTYWGGTRIEPWTPQAGFEGEAGAKLLARSETRRDKRPHQAPMGCWNRMVEPFAPMAMRGLLWHQGCSNTDTADVYSDLMHALYRGWSKRFENPDLSLHFVQLADYRSNFHEIQLAQAKFAAEEPHATMTVSCDAGNESDIHPNEKEIVARRMVLCALEKDYGVKVDSSSPTYASATVSNDVVTLRFTHAHGLYHYRVDWTDEAPFELAGADGKWAKATIENFEADYNSKGQRRRNTGKLVGEDGTLVIKAAGVAEPKRVRYLYDGRKRTTIFNGLNLPLGPFEGSF